MLLRIRNTSEDKRCLYLRGSRIDLSSEEVEVDVASSLVDGLEKLSGISVTREQALDYKSMKTSELRSEMKRLGMSYSGLTRNEIIERLESYAG